MLFIPFQFLLSLPLHLLSALVLNPKVKNTELESIVGASKRQIENAIKILKQEGKIHRDKENRKGKWIITE